MSTGERIRMARLRARMTQKELADKIGVKFSAVHKYESGKVVNLKRETIEALAKALDVKPSWLLCMDDENPSDLFNLQFFGEPEIVTIYNSLSEEKQRDLLRYARFLKADDDR